MKSTIKIGRDASNDIQINEPRISRNHAVITDLGDGYFEIKDLGSTNGTFVNGERITSKKIRVEDKVEVASSIVNWFPEFRKSGLSQPTSNIQEEPHAKICKTISIGSSRQNDIVISESFISNHHAKISLLKNGNYFIEDLGSSNGTFVNGSKVITKNFTKTDVVKIATADLPQNWFQHKNIQPNILKDNKKTIIYTFSLAIIIAGSIMIYFNSCKWFDFGCQMSAQQIYMENEGSLVRIVHDYYYTIEYQGVKYFIGKNKLFKVLEANTSNENLLPFNSVSGSGCFIKDDGTMITSVFIVNPWLNDIEKNMMLEGVINSRTIDGFSLDQDFTVCGETANLIWLSNGLVNNEQNYVAASSVSTCELTEESSNTIQSVKKTLPENVEIVSFYYDSESVNHLHKTKHYFYCTQNPMVSNAILQDTFYSSKDNFDINTLKSAPLNKLLPELSEGSIVLNDRGELVGIVQRNSISFIKHNY
jgi:pSer/pThr/pTyr-binding forkhead associated (FHA) protein